jgi:hypothetical protein
MPLQLIGGVITNNGSLSTNTFTTTAILTVIGSCQVTVNMCAGGGGGGQGDTVTGGDNYGGGGGGSGGYYQNYVLTLSAGTYVMTIGAGGAPGANGPIGGGAPWRGNYGGSGGTTTFDVFLSCSGGGGGQGGDGINQGGGGNPGGGGSPNGSGGGGRQGDNSFVAGGGASGPFGSGGPANYNSGGVAGSGFGSGGSGGNASYSTSINNGGAGAPGFISLTYTPPLTVIATDIASNLTPTTALLNGEVDFLGTILTEQGFDWGTSPSYGSSFTVNGSFAISSFSTTITGLATGTTYHFRAKAYDGSNWFYGSDATFTPVQSPLCPEVITQPATNILSTTCTLNGEIVSTGGENITEMGFDYGVTTLYSNSVVQSGSFGDVFFSSNITGLFPSTTYYYRLKVLNSAGWTYGKGQSLNTGTGSGSGSNNGEKVVCLNDGSSHGGTVVSTNTDGTLKVGGIQVCVQGAEHSCPIPFHGTTQISAIARKSYMNGLLILTYGSTAGCGAVIEPPDRQVYIE